MISKEFIYNTFYSSKTKKDFLLQMGIPFEHRSGTSINKDIKYFLDYANIEDDFSAKSFIKRYNEKCEGEYYNNPAYCKYCNKVISFDKRNKIFCSQSCANSYNNIIRGEHSEYSKQKVSRTLKEVNNIKKSQDINYKKISDCIKENILENPYNHTYIDTFININKCKILVCPECGKIYHTYLSSNNRLRNWKTCSYACNKKRTSKLISLKVRDRINKGIFIGWKTRNIISYPEKFWISVLNNNDIPYIKEYNLDNKYFLDFYIVKNNKIIDLEIDGKQHKYPERINHDISRDLYLHNKDIIIYRIDWNEINSDAGKSLMQEKINKFINFYKNI